MARLNILSNLLILKWVKRWQLVNQPILDGISYKVTSQEAHTSILTFAEYNYATQSQNGSQDTIWTSMDMHAKRQL